MPNTKIYKNAANIERRGYEIIATILELPKMTKSIVLDLHQKAAVLSSTVSDTPPFVADVDQCFDLEQLAIASLVKVEAFSGTNTPVQGFDGPAYDQQDRMSDSVVGVGSSTLSLSSQCLLSTGKIF